LQAAEDLKAKFEALEEEEEAELRRSMQRASEAHEARHGGEQRRKQDGAHDGGRGEGEAAHVEGVGPAATEGEEEGKRNQETGGGGARTGRSPAELLEGKKKEAMQEANLIIAREEEWVASAKDLHCRHRAHLQQLKEVTSWAHKMPRRVRASACSAGRRAATRAMAHAQR